MTKNTKTILGLVLSSTLLGGCAALSNDQMASGVSGAQSARIQGVQPVISYPLHAIGLTQEARIVGIDGKFNSSQFDARISSGKHRLTVQTSCRFQMQEVRNETSMEVNILSGHNYKILLDSDVTKGCVPAIQRVS